MKKNEKGILMVKKETLDSLWKEIRENKENNFKEGASESAIAALEKGIGITLPYSYKEFLKQFDGGEFAFGRMYKINAGGAGFFDFLEELEQAGEYIPLIASRKILPFGDDYGGNLQCFDLQKYKDSEYSIVEWDHEDDEDSNPKQIAENFAEFVIRFKDS